MKNWIVAAVVLTIAQGIEKKEILIGSKDMQGVIFPCHRNVTYKFNAKWTKKPVCTAQQGGKTWKLLPVTEEKLIIPGIDIEGENVYFICMGIRNTTIYGVQR